MRFLSNSESSLALLGMDPDVRSSSSSDLSLRAALAGMLRHPFSSLVMKWNWKSAATSVMLRAPIFFAVTLRSGIRLAVAGALVESALNGLGAGFYGAFLQGIRRARPLWAASLTGAVAVPAAIQVLVNAVHFFAGTIVLRRGIVISIVMSALTALFNLYAMRRGALLTGEEGLSLGQDLLRLPRLAADFLLSAPRQLLSRLKARAKGPGDRGDQSR